MGLEAAWVVPLLSTLVGSGVSAYGAHTANEEREKDARHIADARNRELDAVMQRNQQIANQSRTLYNQRQGEIQPEQSKQAEQEATQARQDQLASTVATPQPDSIPISGSAPTVVKSEIAKRLGEAMTKATDDAKRLGKVGGYGDFFFNEGLKNQSVSRDLGILSDFQRGNLGILPFSQDFAAFRAHRPYSGVGEAMQAGGKFLGELSGAVLPGYLQDDAIDGFGWRTTTKPTLRGLPNFMSNHQPESGFFT